MRNATGSTYTDKIDYYDGLGRPIQTIQVKAGGNGQDLVTQTDYDIYGNLRAVLPPLASDALSGNDTIINTLYTTLSLQDVFS